MFKFTGSVVKVASVLVLFSFLAALMILPQGAAARTAPGGGSLGMVSVNLLDAGKGYNLAGANIAIWDGSGSVVASGLTDDGGYFKAWVAPGSYSIVAQAKGYVPSLSTVAMPATGGTRKVVLHMMWDTPGVPAGLRSR